MTERALTLTARLSVLGLAALVLAIGGSADAAPSANGKIAYASADGAIWVVNPDGSGRRRLVEGTEPSWSPDGSRLVYVGPHPARGTAMYLVNANGGGRHPLTPPGTVGNAPDWSPDGNRIAFARDGDIYAIGVDGSGLRQLTAGAALDYAPSWSPDGLALAFARGGIIWLMGADGDNQRALDVEGYGPRFSPDGHMLAFQDDGAVYVVGADGDGATPRRLSPEGHEASFPRWSPDGSRLAFYGDQQGVCTMRASGGAARRVTFDGSGYGLDWQSNGVSAGRDAPYSCFSPRWDLSVTVTTPKRAAIGDVVRISVFVRNRGSDPAPESSFRVDWSEDLHFEAISSSDRYCGQQVGRVRVGNLSCRRAIIFPGEAVALATITLRARAPGPLRVTADLDRASSDNPNASERDVASVLVGGCTITGTTGADALTGTRRRDVICGLEGNDVIHGLGGDDEIWAGPGDDVVEGGLGNDRIHGGGANDDLDGGDGRDVVWGYAGEDSILGGAGDDALHGSRPRGHRDPTHAEDTDVLDGGSGNDVLEGGEDNDVLRGGRDDDTLLARDQRSDVGNCGRGRDRLVADRWDRQRHCERVSRG